MEISEFRSKGKEVVDFIADYYEKVDTFRVIPDVTAGFLAKTLPQTAPPHGENYDDIVKDFEKKIMPGILHWQSPHFHHYYPHGYSFVSYLADMLAHGVGSVMFSWASSPAGTELEQVVTDWLGKLLHLPTEFLFEPTKTSESEGGGVIQNTASEAVLVCMLAARKRTINKLTNDPADDIQIMSKMVVYASDQVHSCVKKAANICAVKCMKIRTDDNGSMLTEALEKTIESNKKEGLIPFFLCGTLGSTDTCSFDNLTKLGPICKREGLWLHVDAAYAGASFVCPEFRHFLAGVEFADSFNVNPHKLLLTNGYCSVMWVKSKHIIKESLHVDPVYLRKKSMLNGDSVDDESFQPEEYRDWEIPLGRHIKSLKLWFVLRYYGVEGLQKHIRNHVKLAKLFESLVRKDDRFVVVNKVVLGLVCFRLKGSDENTARLIKAVNETGKIHIGPGQFHQKKVIRFCIAAEQTTEKDIHYAWHVIQEQASGIFKRSNNREEIALQSKETYTPLRCVLGD